MSGYLRPIAPRLLCRVMEFGEGCWIWSGKIHRPTGYGRLMVFGKLRGAHVVSYWLHKGVWPGDLFVCHKCDNRLCVNPDHLFLGTNSDNYRDMWAKRRGSVGTRQPNSKLTESDVREIRTSIGPYADIGKRFGVSSNVICRIKLLKSWRHVQ